MADITVLGDNSTRVIVSPSNSDVAVQGSNTVEVVVDSARPVEFVVSGALMGPVGLPGPQGPTGGIVPITVSSTAPASPNINDLWIDIS